jgi:hypothetical protein
MSSRAAFCKKRSAPVSTDTSDVDKFAGLTEGAAGLKLEQAQKRKKKLQIEKIDTRSRWSRCKALSSAPGLSKLRTGP